MASFLAYLKMNSHVSENQKQKRSVKILKGILKTLGVILGLILLLEFIAIFIIPPMFMHRPKAFCSKTESEAQQIAVAIVDYFSNPNHLTVSRSDIEQLVTVENPWTFKFDEHEIVVKVTDHSGQCPGRYQKHRPEWDAGVYTYRTR